MRNVGRVIAELGALCCYRLFCYSVSLATQVIATIDDNSGASNEWPPFLPKHIQFNFEGYVNPYQYPHRFCVSPDQDKRSIA